MNTIYILVLLLMAPNGAHDVGVQLDGNRRPMLFETKAACEDRAKDLLAAAAGQVPWAQARCWEAPAMPTQEMFQEQEQRKDQQRPTRMPENT